MSRKFKNVMLILLVLAAMLAGCAATMDDGFLPDTEALPFATPTPIPQLTLKDRPSATPAPTPEQTDTPAPTPKPMSEEVESLLLRNLRVWGETQERPGMDGRLLIPSAGIDVALCSSGYGEDLADMRQRITDAVDSALLYYDGFGFVIADHSNQAFSSLPLVRQGDVAYILEGNSILTLSCDLCTNGINTGNGITHVSGEPVTDESEFTCYTCGEDWTQIHIVGMNEVDEDLFAISRDADMEGGWRYGNNALNEIVLKQLEREKELAAERAAEAARAAAAGQQPENTDAYN